MHSITTSKHQKIKHVLTCKYGHTKFKIININTSGTKHAATNVF